MNKTKLKAYAPQARKDFIAAVTARANQLGFSASEIVPAEKKGDVMLIAGRSWPVRFYAPRERLATRIRQQGFEQVMEAAAYSWFNRFAALRYMELHDYLSHGFRVLSNPNGGLPEILQHVQDVELQDLNKDELRQLQLAGNKDGEIYRQVLLAQCNALHRAMPFLFEKLDDETELLLPDNLLLTDSVVAKLVYSIDEEDWQQVEIIGWLYQFYISEKKDEVIGKVVKSEDIPAATQLFTPNWIVKYLVQNSVGRLWLQANPQSDLASKMEYYIQPAEQTPEVNAQLDALIKTRIAEDGDALKPESITVLDPACGSGHILVEAYDLLKEIYLERGNRLRDIPRLILQNNLFGLDIDDRAAQLAGFALLMKARADDRRLFDNALTLNVLSLQESKDLSVDELAIHLVPFNVQLATITALVETFKHAKTFGSLIQIPSALNTQLLELPELLALVKQNGDMYAKAAADDLLPLVQQAQMLATQFDAVVANPPYMGGKAFCPLLKSFISAHFCESKGDLFACFIEQNLRLAKTTGFSAAVTMESWMSLSSYEIFREHLLRRHTLQSLAHFPYDGRGPTAMGINFGLSVMSVQKAEIADYIGSFCCSRYYELNEHGVPLEFPTQNERRTVAKANNFFGIPGSPIAYWVSERMRAAFLKGSSLGDAVDLKPGLCTGRDALFIREWFEVNFETIGFGCCDGQASKDSGRKWFPFNKGGPFRKWSGNQSLVVNWRNDGQDLRQFARGEGKGTRVQNTSYYFRSGVTWNQTGSATPSFRAIPPGFIFAHIGAMAFPRSALESHFMLGFLNSCVSVRFLEVISQTLGMEVGHISSLPALSAKDFPLDRSESVQRLVKLSSDDWNSFEPSWEFEQLPIFPMQPDSIRSLEASYENWVSECTQRVDEVRQLEEENNRFFLSAYDLSGEISEKVPPEKVTLGTNPFNRYNSVADAQDRRGAFRQGSMEELISYSIGCMMGRYSLDEPGLIYAHAGNVGFDAERYKTFPADADGIVPITDELWFEDDATNRVQEFLKAVWGEQTLDENMAWLAESLGVKGGETPEETIRRYISGSFYKDHLQTYKKRPIYWLFSAVASRAHSRRWCTCTATTKAHCRVCAPSM
jgi:SAM-dependent methyltransferase